MSSGVSTLYTTHKPLIYSLLFLVVYSTTVVLAAPPTTPYYPTDNITDPTCSPTDTNCYVSVFPDQTSNTGKLLFTDGTNPAWASNLYWDETNDRLGVGTEAPSTKFSIVSTTEQMSLYHDSVPTSGTQISGILFGSNLTGGYNDSAEIRTIYTGDGTTRSADLSFVSRIAGVPYSSLWLTGKKAYIGHTLPSAPPIYPASFTVRGSGSTSSTYTAQFHNSTGASNSLTIRDDGLVAIKDIEIRSDYATNVFIGQNAGLANTPLSSTQGRQNTFLGAGAGEKNTTGYAITNVGYASGYYNTTGITNTNIGYQAGFSNITGSGNTSIGTDAGGGNLADNNIFIGFHSGGSVATPTITGVNNIFIGGETAGYGTTLNHNTSVGYRSSLQITSGYNNAIYGTFAGLSLTTGYNNVLFGKEAGQSLTNSYENFYMGFRSGFGAQASTYNNTGAGAYSLFGVTTGVLNTALGHSAGFSLTTGQQNVFIGSGSGNNVLQKIDAVNSIAIGRNTYTTLSNQVVIGNSSITETIFAGNIYMGGGVISTPSARLHVKGSSSTSSTYTAQFHNSTGTNNALIVRDDGWVGIGSSAPLGSDMFTVGGQISLKNANRIYLWNSGNTLAPYIVNEGSGIGLYTNAGAPAIKYDSAANVSIAGSSITASARLHVVGSGSTSSTYTAQFHNSTGTSNSLVIRGDGKVGVGTASPIGNLDIYGDTPTLTFQDNGITWSANQLTAFGLTSKEIISISNYSGNDGGVMIKGFNKSTSLNSRAFLMEGYVENDPTNHGVFHLNSFKHDGSGALTTVGNTGILLNVANNSSSRLVVLGDGSVSVSSLISCGGIQTNGSGTMSCTSDETLKNVTGSFNQGLSSIRLIQPQSFTWKEDSGLYDNDIVYHGFIAQNVQQALPEAITLSNNGKLQVSQLTITAALVNAVKALDVKLTSLSDLSIETPNTLGSLIKSFIEDSLNIFEQIFVKRIKSESVETKSVESESVKTKELCTSTGRCLSEEALESLIDSVNADNQDVSSPTPSTQTESVTDVEMVNEPDSPAPITDAPENDISEDNSNTEVVDDVSEVVEAVTEEPSPIIEETEVVEPVESLEE